MSFLIKVVKKLGMFGVAALLAACNGLTPDGDTAPGDALGLAQVAAAADGPQVSTLAGSGLQGFGDGQGQAVKFNAPGGIAMDSRGNVYVADSYNHRIRKVSPTGVVSTLAGTGTAGFADGSATTAQFYAPASVALDSRDNVYVADFGNHRIRKITPSGAVSTLAGTGTAGFADGPGTTAQFRFPLGVAADRDGNVYVADYSNQRIRKVTTDGVVSTFAGTGAFGFLDGAVTVAKFFNPFSVALDGNGNVYVGDYGNNRIRKISGEVVSTVAGSSTRGFADGAVGTALFNGIGGLTVDSAGNVYVSDSNNNRIRKVTAAGVVSTLAGTATGDFKDGAGSVAQFFLPNGIALDNDGNIYVGDTGNNRIRKITSAGAVTLTTCKRQGDISFVAKLYGIRAGDYRLSWDLTTSPYQISASLVPTGFAAALVPYSIHEQSKGIFSNEYGLFWQGSEVSQYYGVKDQRNKTDVLSRMGRNGNEVRMPNGTIVTFPVGRYAADIHSLFVQLMCHHTNLSTLQSEVFLPSAHETVTVNKVGEEDVVVPAGKFATTHWVVNEPVGQLDLWHDRKTGYPVKMTIRASGYLVLLEAGQYNR